MSSMLIEQKEAKSLIRQSGPSIFSWSEIYLNPYQGCFHNCVYCDGKSEHYHMHDDFGTRIMVKTNAPTLFKTFLKKKGFNPIHKKEQFAIYDFFPSLKELDKPPHQGRSIITIGGGVCDVYQPAEKEMKMTRKLLEIVYDYQLPLWILTKNKLVLRDIDIIKEINKETYACVNFTITLMNEKSQKIFEPGASTTQERFDAIKMLRKEGIHSGIYFYPALPFIGDTDENIQALYKRANEVKSEFVYCYGLTLKPGRSKNEFMQTLQKHYPDIYPKYNELYGNNNKYGHLDYHVFKQMNLVWPEIKGFKYGYEYKLGYTAERYIPEGRIYTNLKLSELLRKIVFIKSSLLQDSKFDVQSFSKAANYIENSQKDFGQLDESEYDDIPVSQNVKQVITDFLVEKESSFLEKLEKRTYEYIVKKYYNS
ncbi:MAG: radical SAM protein [Candidatus Heimdallarchaeota archaeon]|nr:radical SAM protein [Candidatus Heimdallarchaeota archaeon]